MNKKEFKKYIESRHIKSIDLNRTFKNLSKGFWVYDELLGCLERMGWKRFACGFKSGVYANSNNKYCIKILGMGVGDNPLYFCERGYYLEHERNMMLDFSNEGFKFLPKVLSISESIDFLIRECELNEQQAIMRCCNNDLLIMDYISGIPFATVTGHYLNIINNIEEMNLDNELILEMEQSLYDLKKNLHHANNKELLHNDPMPSNIIFTLDENDKVTAKLVDFEMAQNLKKKSPEYVNESVCELYKERNVPYNIHTNKHTMNIDEYLIEKAILSFKEVPVSSEKAKKTLIIYKNQYQDIEQEFYHYDTKLKEIWDKSDSEYDKSIFLMMPFKSDLLYRSIADSIKRICAENGFKVFRVDDENRSLYDRLWDNIVLNMLSCKYGIAVYITQTSIDKTSDEILFFENPNVALEFGFMKSRGKKILILKDDNSIIPSDLDGFLWKSFDIKNPDLTIPNSLCNWLRQLY
jgi:serine/threonine protein kinase